MLYSELKKYEVVAPLGDKIGKVEDVVVHIKDWNIKEVAVSPGLFKKTAGYSFDAVKNVDDNKKRVVIEGEARPASKPTTGYINVNDLMRKKIFSSDEKEIGKMYDAVVVTKPEYWRMEKVLIHHGTLKRRLRLSSSEIESVADKIVLLKTYEEVEGVKEEPK
ncbi:MAG: PRC-barrel domain-containing protein [Thermoplasmatales archaeon]|nr:PRC-barrel domain-containing protein [Thermoplasmatales archaeon]